MREIKFRGKRLDNDEWVHGSLAINSSGSCQISDWSDSIRWWMSADPKTVEQFTGCYDKNGKEIYEGNILSDGFEKWWVQYSETDTGFFATNKAKSCNTFSLWHLCHKRNGGREVEIIGDIHDFVDVNKMDRRNQNE